MKKLIFFISAVVGVLVLTKCSSSKKAIAEKPKLNYETDLSTVIMNNCVPCHIPAKGGNKRPYDNYANVQKDIDEMIRRIELNPTDRGFMPFKRGKLSDSTIAIFKQWKADGMLEK
ncbi:MAG TPA: hypothetical protein PKC72_16460 [Chitinophagaceae bacterium]|nr:hypothetical protein [Chitinophagaceae bacterium]